MGPPGLLVIGSGCEIDHQTCPAVGQEPGAMPSKRGCTEMKAIHVMYRPKCFNRDLALSWASKCPSSPGWRMTDGRG